MDQDQASMIVDDEHEILDAGSETDESPDPIPVLDPLDRFSRIGMVKIGEETGEHQSLKRRFLSGMEHFADNTTVVAIHRFTRSNLPIKARFLAFKNSVDATSQKNGGVVNVRQAWFSGSKEDICQIMSYGFSKPNGQLHGVGVYLTPTKHLLDGLGNSICDENGLRHILFCGVIMGRMEAIPLGSKQIYPSSPNFDSGVDNLEDPRNLIVWTAFMNSRICPAYVLSFKTPSYVGSIRNQIGTRSHTFIHLADLTTILVKVLGPDKGALIRKTFDAFCKRKITRMQLIQGLKRVVGDNRLFIAIIQSNRDELQVRGASSSKHGALAEAAANIRRKMA